MKGLFISLHRKLKKGTPMTIHSAKPEKTIVVQQQSGPGCLIQSLWFVFVGWWLGALVISIAWLLNITILGLPLGMAILNNIPKVLALQNPKKQMRAVTSGGATVVTETNIPQHNFFVRAAFFLLIGWWWSGVWIALAYLMCATILLLPVGLEMFRMTPAMTTLRRY